MRTQTQALCIQYTNKNAVAIEFSRREDPNVPLQDRSLIAYKMARQSRQRAIKNQSALCKVACKLNSLGLKICVVSKISKNIEKAVI